VEWDGYTITDADELYHAAWGNVSGTATFASPLPSCRLVRVNDAAFKQAVAMGAMPCPETTWLLEVAVDAAMLDDAAVAAAGGTGGGAGAGGGSALVSRAEYEMAVRKAPPGRFVETEF
jgi:hypothetical protein